MSLLRFSALLRDVMPALLLTLSAAAAVVSTPAFGALSAPAAATAAAWRPAVEDVPRDASGVALPSGARRFRAARVDEAPKIDGWLDEDVWLSSEPMELRYETSPAENAPAPVRTVCRLLHTEAALYFGCYAYDDPADIRARFSDRDQSRGDDTIGLAIDPFNQKNLSLVFDVNPLGVQNDRRYTELDGESDASWDVLWDAAGRLVSDGYIVEAEIPFSSLPFPSTAGEQIWGFNFRRYQPRDVYRRISILPHDRSNPCRTCQQWELVGFEEVKQGRNLEITPTLTGVQRSTRSEFPDGELVSEDPELDPGVSLDWGITSNLRVGATINPDFSQVEADDARLDVNESFALFFPERRPFFLRSADRFRTDIPAVYTRSIADPEWALRFTGDLGKNSLAVLTARDSVTTVVVPGVESSSLGSSGEGSDVAVLRYRRDVGEASTIGALLTDRTSGDYRNTVAGADARLRVAQGHRLSLQVLGSRSEIGPVFAAASGLSQFSADDWAVEGGYTRETRNWFGRLWYEDFGDDFRADSGFVTRVGIRGPSAQLRRRWHGGAEDWFTKIEVQVEAGRHERSDGSLHAERRMVWARLEGALQSRFSLGYFNSDRVFSGTLFAQDGFWGDFNLRPSAEVQFGLGAGYHDEIDVRGVRLGKQTRIGPWVSYTPGRRVRTSLKHSWRTLDLPVGELFVARQTELRAVYQWSSRTFLRAVVQWTDLRQDPALFSDAVDPRRSDLFGQFLFTYRLDPQTALYVGYSLAGLELEREIAPLGDTVPAASRLESTGFVETGNAIFFKVGYTWQP